MFAKMNKLRNKLRFQTKISWSTRIKSQWQEKRVSSSVFLSLDQRMSKSNWSVDLCIRHIRCHQATETQINTIKNLEHAPSRDGRPVKWSPVLWSVCAVPLILVINVQPPAPHLAITNTALVIKKKKPKTKTKQKQFPPLSPSWVCPNKNQQQPNP